MEKLGNFLWKIFSATMMFFFNIGVDSANADTCSDSSYNLTVTYSCGTGTTGTPEVETDTACKYGSYTPKGIGTCKKAGYVFSGTWSDSGNTRTVGQPYSVTATEPFTLTPIWTDETGVAKMSTYFTSSDVETNSRSHRICPAGKYLYSCGSNVIGTNWLRGMSTGTYASHDYYSYNLDDSDTTNMSNLRKFFNGTETIGYYARNGSETTLQTVSPSEYKIELNKILSIFCTDKKGQITETVCKKCPNNGFIKESNVQTEDNYTSAKILWDTWNVHTIADCYMNEFTDSTGTYIYKSANIADSGTTGNKCYYLAGVAGNHLYYK